MSNSNQPYKTNITSIEYSVRSEALSLAIDLIHASLNGGASAGASANLSNHLKNLPEYVETIEKELKKA